MDEMILIPKILESVTCNVYKSRVAALMRYNEILLNLLCKTRIQFSSKYCQENKQLALSNTRIYIYFMVVNLPKREHKFLPLLRSNNSHANFNYLQKVC